MKNIHLGKNLKRLRDVLNLSEQKFATLLSLSRSTIVNIELGDDVEDSTVAKILILFYMYSWDKINNAELEIDSNLKEILLSHFDGDTHFTTILNSRPTIRYAIEQRLLKTPFLNTFRETNDIRNELFKQFGWKYKSLSKTINKMTDLLEIVKSDKGGTHMYRKKSD